MPKDLVKLKSVGMEMSSKNRSASFLMVDQSVRLISRYIPSGLEIMNLKEALKKYDWLDDYMWKIVEEEGDFDGYFIRALKNSRISFPVEACLYLKRIKTQKVHNIIIAEENSEIDIITGCTSERLSGLHLGISEFFIKRGARVSFTMIHNWEKDVEVFPKTGIIVEEGATFINNYVLLSPVKKVKAYPFAILEKDARAFFNSIVAAFENSDIDIGNKVVLKGKGSCAEIVSRCISKGGRVTTRGYIVAESEGVRGHLECRGMIIGGGTIHAIPELEARNPNVDLSHEAAIGKIAEDEIFYLMSRGLSRDEAVSLIIRGFMDVDIKDIPDILKREIEKAVKIVEKDLL